MMDWLRVHRGGSPLVIAFPHGGTSLAGLDDQFVSPWLARYDTDWWIAELYAIATRLGATSIATDISRAVIDVNRNPSGASLYPGQATTELCPTTTFDGRDLYRDASPDAAEIDRRRVRYFDPYHAAIAAELERVRGQHGHAILYDAHSIRSHVPRLFADELPQFNIGTNGGESCDPTLEHSVSAICSASGYNHVVNGRFKGGWTTRHHGRPADGVHAIQMELAMRGYMSEPAQPDEINWPSPVDPARADGLVPILTNILKACSAFATA